MGLQTSKSETVEYIRCGYKNEVYNDAVNKLRGIGVHIITHIILGLPGETRNDMLSSVMYALDACTNGIKLQLLHVLKDTDLEADYLDGKFSTMEIEEYVDTVIACLKIIPEMW